MTEAQGQIRYDKIMRILLFCIIWYTEFAVRYFQFPNTLLVLGALLLLFLLLDYFSCGREKIGSFTMPFVFLSIYEIYTIAYGIMVAPDKKAHIQQSITMIEYTILYIAVVYYSKKNSSVDFLVWNYAIMYTLMCIIFLISPVWYLNNSGFKRLSFAVTMNPNTFGICMVTGTWCLLYLASQKKIPILLSLVGTAFSVYAIFLSGSRKGIIGIAIVIFLWLYLCFIRNTDPNKPYLKWTKILLSISLIAILYVILMPYYSSSILAQRMSDIGEEATEGARSEMYIFGWKLFKNSPLFGYGLRGFDYFYGGYSHATLVEVPVSGGILGTVLYLLFHIAILKSLFQANRLTNGRQTNISDRIRPRMGLILYAAMLFYSIALIHIYEISSYIYFGMIVSTSFINEKKQKDAEKLRLQRCRYIR